MRSAFVLSSLAAAAAAPPQQIHISYTGKPAELAVDFVATEASGFCEFSVDNSTFTRVASTSFSYLTIGNLHQGLMSFPPSTTKGYYRVGTSSGVSQTFEVSPVPARFPSEVHAIFGDFGAANDASMSYLIEDAQKGTFDSVLHVGDWVR
jgi:hypothetical protein